MNNTHKSNQERPWWKKYVVELTAALSGLVAMNLIFIAETFHTGSKVQATAAGQLGDFVGGYVGTAFLLLSVVLLYSTLRNQREVAQRQFFESRFFELIKLHRDNVSEMQLQGTEGRRVFIKLLLELRAIAEILKDVAQNQKQTLEPRQALQISYYCLFFGAGADSSRMLRSALSRFNPSLVNDLDRQLCDQAVRDRVRQDNKLGYTPFEGHQSRLGHYYRHLYQSVRYADTQSIDLNKYDYVKTLRAQLTTHEQVLLLINSLTPIGNDWWKHDLILRYRMVQNIPRYFLDPTSEVDTSTLFPKGYFEWEEADAT